jgi:hypothetical protein
VAGLDIFKNKKYHASLKNEKKNNKREKCNSYPFILCVEWGGGGVVATVCRAEIFEI